MDATWLITAFVLFVIARLPLPVCRRVRARRRRTVRGRAYGGSGAAQKEKFFGWRWHLRGDRGAARSGAVRQDAAACLVCCCA